ncbi:MAG: hypothetical protein JNJ83_22040 [Verrucomicrobiaceae bacterium]|nr:hypothetical protein [Verrucomicrobiaceae bacterium]
MANDAPDIFPPTRWTLLQRLQDGSGGDAMAALEQICKSYWSPLYFVARSRGYTTHDAQDAVQGFFESLLRRETLAKADQAAGKLRQLLLRSFENYCGQQWHKAARVKRGGAAEHVPFAEWMDSDEAERHFLQTGTSHSTAEQLYNREWANSLLKRSLTSLQQDYTHRGWTERYDALVRLLLEQDDGTAMDAATQRLGTTTNNVRVILHRMRGHYRDHIERELGRTLDTDDPILIRKEMVELFQAMA